MATITRLMTTLDAGTTPGTVWDNLAGTAFGNANTDTGPAGSGATSISEKISKTVQGLLYDDATTGTFASGDHLSMWYYFLFGALDTRAGGGIRFRLCGNTVTDFAEVYIDGNDSGKSGWNFVVVSIDRILSNPDNTGGTPPTAASAIRYAGIVFDVTATVGGNNDNCAIQAIHHIPAGTSAFRIQGDGSSATVTWDDIASGVLADAGRGIVIKNSNGTFTLNAPLLVGKPDTGSAFNTELTDTGVVLAWDNQEFVEPEFYGFTVSANGTQTVDVDAGTKIGTGSDAVGVNGWSISTGGPRWFVNAEDADTDSFNMYGCAFSGSSEWQVNDVAVEILSCVFVDCDTIEMDGGSAGPVISKNFFAGAPGPKAQVRILNATDFASNQFIGNSFVNMSWFGLDFALAGTFTLTNTFVQGNGTARSVLLSHDTGLITINTGGTTNIVTADVTNGSTFTITMGGTPDLFLFTIATWDEVDQTDVYAGGNAGSATGTLAQVQHNVYSVDDDSLSIAAARVPALSEILFDQTGDTYDEGQAFDRDIDFLSARMGIDNLTPSATQREQDPSHSATETETAQIILEIQAAVASTPVSQIDPTFRPWQRVTGASSISGVPYGAGTEALNPNRRAFVVVVALDDTTAADTAVSSVAWDTGAGSTNFDAVVSQHDDNTGGGGSTSSLRASVLDLNNSTGGAALEQGTFSVVNSVTTSFTNIRTGSEVRVFDTGVSTPIAGTEDVTGSLTSATLVNAGTGYVGTDTLTVSGGTFTTAAVITVDTVGGSGEILTFSITTPGSYSVDPTNVVNNPVTGGTGSAATFALSIRGEFDWAYNAATQGAYDLVVHHAVLFVYLKLFSLTPATADTDLPVFQIPERNYSNP